jgi:hypothetical protein
VPEPIWNFCYLRIHLPLTWAWLRAWRGRGGLYFLLGNLHQHVTIPLCISFLLLNGKSLHI